MLYWAHSSHQQPGQPAAAGPRDAALFHQHWRAEKKNLPLAKAVIAAVEAHIKTVPLARG